jgi:type III pantothenate kinase
MSDNLFLLLDVGNTGVKIGLARKDGLAASFTLPTDPRETSDSLGLKLMDLCRFQGLSPADVEAMAVSSVSPPMNPIISETAERYFGRRALFVPDDIELDIENHYERPQEVGADRLVAAFAARRLLSEERIIVVDFGTATTFDCIQGNAYLGGLICPGVMSSAKALASSTAKLPQIDLHMEPGEGLRVGRSTKASLNQGLIHGFAAMTEGLVDRLRQAMGGPAAVVATGGLAGRIAQVCTALDMVKPDLMLDGLRVAWLERQERC